MILPNLGGIDLPGSGHMDALVLGKDQYFVAGDSRSSSSDSRHWGSSPRGIDSSERSSSATGRPAASARRDEASLRGRGAPASKLPPPFTYTCRFALPSAPTAISFPCLSLPFPKASRPSSWRRPSIARRASRNASARLLSIRSTSGAELRPCSPLRLWDRLLSGLSSLAGGRLREWTVEANPDSLGPAILDVFVRRGVTRLSLGVQSPRFRGASGAGKEARSRGRPSSPCISRRKGGLALSADLIAGGAPAGRRLRRRKRSAGGRQRARALCERAFRRRGQASVRLRPYARGRARPWPSPGDGLVFPSEDEAYDSRLLLEDALSYLGMRRYEVSNYAVPGAECLHNLKYWRMDSYIGAGTGRRCVDHRDGRGRVTADRGGAYALRLPRCGEPRLRDRDRPGRCRLRDHDDGLSMRLRPRPWIPSSAASACRPRPS